MIFLLRWLVLLLLIFLIIKLLLFLFIFLDWWRYGWKICAIIIWFLRRVHAFTLPWGVYWTIILFEHLALIRYLLFIIYSEVVHLILRGDVRLSVWSGLRRCAIAVITIITWSLCDDFVKGCYNKKIKGVRLAFKSIDLPEETLRFILDAYLILAACSRVFMSSYTKIW